MRCKVLPAVPSNSLNTFTPSLANLLEPLQFKAVLLVSFGLENHQIAQCLRATEGTIRNVLWTCCQCTGCRDIDELVRRYFSELATGLLELGRLQGELAELEARVAQRLDRLPESQGQYLN